MDKCMRKGPLIVLMLLACSWVNAANVEDKTDRFTGIRSVSYKPIPEKNGYSVNLAAYFAKNDPQPIYFLEILTWSNKWRYLNCTSNAWLLDDNPEPGLQGKYENSMGGSATIERFVYEPDRKVLERLVSAKKAEYKLCNDELEVSKTDIDGMRRVLEATK